MYDEFSVFVAFLAGGAQGQRVAGAAERVVVVPLAVETGIAAATHLADRAPVGNKNGSAGSSTKPLLECQDDFI